MTEGPELAAWLSRLEVMHPIAIDMGLERVRVVAERLGILEAAPRSVIVTGTNGKGSCVHTLTALLEAHGQRVGLYTSPHLRVYNERIRIDGSPATDAAIIDAFEAIEIARHSVSLTYFEFGTLAALWLFCRARVDVMVLEVGLGGRLDAVNIVDPSVSVITSIDLDHQDWLGADRLSVCTEKAGIRRPFRPLICGDAQPPDNLASLCEESNTPLRRIGRDFVVVTEGQKRRYVCGNHDIKFSNRTLVPSNIACALDAALQLGVELDPGICSSVIEGLVIEGRRQQVADQPAVYVDVAHNPHAAESLAQWLEHHIQGRIIAVVGMLSDKDVAGVIACMIPVVDHWIAVGTKGPRGCSARKMSEMLESSGVNVVGQADSAVEGLFVARKHAGAADSIIIFGSFVTVADVLARHD